MAGSSSDDNENYWPGYVDALTTMTMVLTFVMMVLGVMVFVLSQDAVSSKMGMIARALRIEARQLDRLNQVEIEDALRRAVARKDTGDGVAPQIAGDQIGIDEHWAPCLVGQKLASEGRFPCAVRAGNDNDAFIGHPRASLKSRRW